MAHIVVYNFFFKFVFWAMTCLNLNMEVGDFSETLAQIYRSTTEDDKLNL
jgi:hypothetical protein